MSQLKTSSVKTKADALKLYNELNERRAMVKKREESLITRQNIMANQPVVSSGDMGSKLRAILPPHLAPKNLGKINNVMWDFFYPVKFTLENPTYNDLFRAIENFQINIEASFLLYGISIDSSHYGKEGLEAPLTMTVRNASSTRQFNDIPFPIQNIGRAGLPFLFDSPLLLAGNSTIEVELSSFAEDDQVIADTVTFDVTFFGLRVRDENSAEVITTMFL